MLRVSDYVMEAPQAILPEELRVTHDSWAPSGGNNATASPLCPGTYTVTVTDANGCTTTGSTTITQPPQLNANATGTNVTCFGLCNGSATSAPSGGTGPYTYLWQPGGQTTPSISGLCAGSYTSDCY
jgi:hypothetical protein